MDTHGRCLILTYRNYDMSSKLFVGSLPFATTEDELRELFSQAGEVASARVITDKFTGRSRGFGFVEMSSADAAQKAIQMFNNYSMQGRTIVVSEARPMRDKNDNGGGY
mgnify:CR=1 FL=1